MITVFNNSIRRGLILQILIVLTQVRFIIHCHITRSWTQSQTRANIHNLTPRSTLETDYLSSPPVANPHPPICSLTPLHGLHIILTGPVPLLLSLPCLPFLLLSQHTTQVIICSWSLKVHRGRDVLQADMKSWQSLHESWEHK